MFKSERSGFDATQHFPRRRMVPRPCPHAIDGTNEASSHLRNSFRSHAPHSRRRHDGPDVPPRRGRHYSAVFSRRTPLNFLTAPLRARSPTGLFFAIWFFPPSIGPAARCLASPADAFDLCIGLSVFGIDLGIARSSRPGFCHTVDTATGPITCRSGRGCRWRRAG
jgi:hypothetical protein